MNVEGIITIVTRMRSVQTLSAPINASAQQDIPVMAWIAQVRMSLILFPFQNTSSIIIKNDELSKYILFIFFHLLIKNPNSIIVFIVHQNTTELITRFFYAKFPSSSTFVCSSAYERNLGMFYSSRRSLQSRCLPLSGIFGYSCYFFEAEIRLFHVHKKLAISGKLRHGSTAIFL